MAIQNFYNTGTVSITAGTTSLVGVGTSWLNAIRASDQLWIAGIDCRVLTVVDNTHITLAYNWPGLTAAGSLYEIRTPPPTSDLSVTIRTFVAAIASGPINDILNASFLNNDLLQYSGANLTRIPVSTLFGQIGDTDGTLAANSDTVFPSQKAVKTYIGNLAASVVHWVPACFCATTGNIALTGEQNIDSAGTTSASRVCVQAQTTPSQNGIYVSAAGAWSRSAETNTGAGLQGAMTFVSGGTVNGKTIKVFTPNAITLGTTAVVVANAYGPGTYSNGTGISLAANVFSIANNAITYALFQQVAASSLVGNATGSLANATGITLGAALAFSGSVLQTAAMTGDVTSSANSFGTTVAKIAGVAVGTPTGTTNVVFSNSPTLVTPTLGAAIGTSLALGGASLSGNILAVTGAVGISGNFSMSGLTSVVNFRGGNTILSSYATGAIQHGAADAAAPVAQIISIQNVVGGTSNTAGVSATYIGSLPTGSGTPGDYIFQTGFQGVSATGTPTISIASPAVITLAAHGYSIGEAVIFTNAGGALPTGINSGQTYYVIAAGFTSGQFEISASFGGAAVNTTGSSTGTQTVASATAQQAAVTALTIKGGTQALIGTGPWSAPSLALGGASLSGNALAVTGTAAISGAVTAASLALGGASLSGNALAVTGGVAVSTGLSIGSNLLMTASAATIQMRNNLTILSSPANAVFQFGAADAASAVAQTLQVQNVVGGTSNVGGQSLTVIGSLPTGSGTPGDIIFKTGFQGVSATGVCTISVASPAVITRAAHGYSIGEAVIFTNAGGALPTGINSGVTYYIIAAGFTSGQFEIAATPGGAAINTTGSSTGTQTVASATAQQAAVTAMTIKGGTQSVVFGSSIVAATTVRTTPVLVANLGTAASAGAGARWFVTDANATTFASIVTGGGANGVPVYSDGTNWRIG